MSNKKIKIVKKNLIKKNNLGFMQGRLVSSEKKNRIQYFPEKNWKKEILIAKKNKFKIMEWTANIENLKKNPIYLEKQIKDLKNFLLENNMQVSSLTCDFLMQKPFFKNNKNKFVLDILRKIIKNSQTLGIKYFIVPLVDQSSIQNKRQEDKIRIAMKKFEKKLYKNSKILFEIDYSPKKSVQFIKSFNSSKFGINLDTGDGAGYGYNYENKSYLKYVKNIHLKDKKYKGKSIRLGRGDFDFKKFLKIIKKIKYKGNLILQPARAKNNRNVYELNLNRKYIYKLL